MYSLAQVLIGFDRPSPSNPSNLTKSFVLKISWLRTRKRLVPPAKEEKFCQISTGESVIRMVLTEAPKRCIILGRIAKMLPNIPLKDSIRAGQRQRKLASSLDRGSKDRCCLNNPSSATKIASTKNLRR